MPTTPARSNRTSTPRRRVSVWDDGSPSPLSPFAGQEKPSSSGACALVVLVILSWLMVNFAPPAKSSGAMYVSAAPTSQAAALPQQAP